MYLLDVSRLIWRRWAGRIPTGIDRVCLAYLDRFSEESFAVVQRHGRVCVLDETPSRALFDLLRQPSGEFRRRFIRMAATWPWKLAPSSRWEGAIYLNLGHTGLDHPALGQWVKDHRLRAVYFVHDLIPLTHPEYCRPGEDARHAKRMTSVLESGAGVIANSQQTLDDLSDWATNAGYRLPPMVASLLGSDLTESSPPSPSRKAKQARPTFVTVGTIEGRKNHLLLLQAWARIAAGHGDRTPQLIIVGQRGWESEQATDMLDRAQVLKGHVVERAHCSDPELTEILSEARALLFPSFVEGYGLPLAEAFRQRTPVIASDLPVFREIGGDIPLFLDPLDGPAWIDAILDYASAHSIGRATQVERLAGFEAPTWAGHFETVIPWLDALDVKS